MIDLHAHVLPGVDDGVRNEVEALDLLGSMERDGVRAVAVTPHLRADHPRVEPARLAAQVASLQRLLDDAGVGIELFVGGEVDMAWAYRADDESLRRVSYRQMGRDLLLEAPYGPLAPAFDSLVASLQARGYRVLIAHPERNPTFKDEPSRLAALVADGALLQVGADSLVDLPRRSRTRRLASALVAEGLAHVLASDSHGTGAGRHPRLSAAAAVADRLAPGSARQLLVEGPAAVLAGEPLPRRRAERSRPARVGARGRTRRPV
jgi:protein-tyrosine phosphatase